LIRMKNHSESLKYQNEQWTPLPELEIISEGLQFDGLSGVGG